MNKAFQFLSLWSKPEECPEVNHPGDFSLNLLSDLVLQKKFSDLGLIFCLFREDHLSFPGVDIKNADFQRFSNELLEREQDLCGISVFNAGVVFLGKLGNREEGWHIDHFAK